ncbi:MAG: hypothetical protein CL859_07295 [Cyanobium sp. ARS6]|nr:hypothetical protein [Cyanobium sp. ARS6]
MHAVLCGRLRLSLKTLERHADLNDRKHNELHYLPGNTDCLHFFLYPFVVIHKFFAMNALGFNDLFIGEVERVLSPFARVSTSLRNAAILAVAHRHSVYAGADEFPTSRADRGKIAKSPYLEAPDPPNPYNYVRRLAARLGMADELPDVYDALDRINKRFPLLERAITAIVVTNENLPVSFLSICVGLSQMSITRIVSTCLIMPFSEVSDVLRPQHIAPAPRRPTRPHVEPTVLPQSEAADLPHADNEQSAMPSAASCKSA